MADTPQILFGQETDDQILDRFYADLGDPADNVPWNRRPGSVVHALLLAYGNERRRVVDFAQFVAGLGFLQFSQGQFLDAKAIEFGVTRQTGSSASVLLTISGSPDTIIPAGTSFSTEGNDTTGDPGVTFVSTATATIDLTGQTTVTANALTVGTAGNVGADEITLLRDPLIGVDNVTNASAASGGVDPQDDEALRADALSRARSIPRGGNDDYYIDVAQQDVEVDLVYVDDLWAGNGTGRLIVGGLDTPYVSPAAVERLQQSIDPSVVNLAHFENEPWTGGTDVTDAPVEGAGSRLLNAPPSSSASMTLIKSINLSDYSAPTDEVWLEAQLLTGVGTVSALTVQFATPGGVTEAYAQATILGVNIDSLPNILTDDRIIVPISQFLVTNGTGVFSWSNIGQIIITLIATGTGTAQIVLDGMRARRTFGGLRSGLANIGIQITVRSARSVTLNIGADVLLDGGFAAADVLPEIRNNLTELLKTQSPGSTIRLTNVSNAIHDAEGVLDYDNVTIDGVADNFTLTADQRPLLGDVILGGL